MEELKLERVKVKGSGAAKRVAGLTQAGRVVFEEPFSITKALVVPVLPQPPQALILLLVRVCVICTS